MEVPRHVQRQVKKTRSYPHGIFDDYDQLERCIESGKGDRDWESIAAIAGDRPQPRRQSAQHNHCIER